MDNDIAVLGLVLLATVLILAGMAKTHRKPEPPIEYDPVKEAGGWKMPGIEVDRKVVPHGWYMGGYRTADRAQEVATQYLAKLKKQPEEEEA